MIHTGRLYDVQLGYYENQLAQDEFTIHPPCEQQSAIPMDTRLLKMLVFLFVTPPTTPSMPVRWNGDRRAPTGFGTKAQRSSSGTRASLLTTGTNFDAHGAPSSLLLSGRPRRIRGSQSGLGLRGEPSTLSRANGTSA